MEPIIKNEIRLDLVYGLIKENWKTFFKVTFITSVVTIILLFCIPRHYVVSVKLVPEYGETSSAGALSTAASMFGINMGSQGVDAIVPEFYPDIVGSTEFLVPIMDINVETQDGDFNGTYAQYILKKEKHPWWIKLIDKVKKLLVSESEPYNPSADYKVDPFRLTKAEDGILKRMAESIDCVVDEKTSVITLSVKAQDPLVAANMAISVKEMLQEFITRYRTEKNHIELDQSKAMCDSAYVKYVEAQRTYAEFVDKHQVLKRQIFKVEEERLAGEMQLAFNTYNTLCQQKLLNEAELLKRTPAFTVLQNASVPIKPASSHKLVKTAAMAMLSALIYLILLIARDGNGGKKETPNDVAETEK